MLPVNELTDKLGEAQNRFNAVRNPAEAHEAIRDMTEADVRAIFERCKINDQNTMRVFGASPLWVPRHVVKASAAAIAESASTENPIPDDIDVMVRGHAQEVLLRKAFPGYQG